MDYKSKLFICLILVLATSLASYADEADDHYNRGNEFFAAGEYESAVEEYRKALELRPDHIKAQIQKDKAIARLDGVATTESFNCIYINNEYVEITANADEANFSMGTTGGHPENPNDNYKKLIFSHPCNWSNFSTVRIDGSDYKYGSSSGVFTAEPYIDGDSIKCLWQLDSIAIAQHFSIVTSTATGFPDTAEIRYVIQNNDSQDHEVGLRVMLDTMLGSNDGAPIDIPESPYVNYEREFYASNMPQYWSAVAGTITNPTFKAYGTLIGGEATFPDKFVTAYWPTIVVTLWDYSASTSRYVTGDSPVGIWWNPISISPGSSRTIITYYGLGRLPEVSENLVLDLTVPAVAGILGSDYSPNPFQANLTVRHSTGAPMSGVTAQISLPNGLALYSGQPPIVNMGDIPTGGVGQATWYVCITGDVVDDTLMVGASAASTSPDLDATTSRTIHIPPIVGNVSVVDGSGNAQSTFYL